MADPEHLAVVKKGAKAIEEWQESNKEQKLDLTGANLSELYLKGANLSKANLTRANMNKTRLQFANLTIANLSEANLSKAYLFNVNLSAANLSKVNFSRANLNYANLVLANFADTNFSGATLEGTIIRGPILISGKINLKNAVLNCTSLVQCDMNKFENLETITHKGPSQIDIYTLIGSYLESDDFERKMEPFFLQAGVPKSLLDSLPEIIAGITYCNCFVCYGEPDRAFAEKLVKDLRTEEIGCWIYSMDATPGEKIWREIAQKRQEADKMIVLCSVRSLIRDGVKKEIEEQLDEDPEKMIPISLDNFWKEEGFSVKRGQRDLKPYLIECTYADFSDHSKYDTSFRRLLKALKKSKK